MQLQAALANEEYPVDNEVLQEGDLSQEGEGLPEGETLLRVGEDYLETGDLIRYLRLTLNWPVIQGLVKRTLIEQALDDHDIEVEEESLEARVEEFRAERGLLTAAETEAWLAERSLTTDDLYDLCEFAAGEELLKMKLFDDEKVRERFVFKRSDYDRVELYMIEVKSEDKARELAALVRDGKSFFELARQHSENDETRKLCGYSGICTRSSLRPELESRIYGAERGDVLGPVKSLGSHYLILVEEFHPAELDQTTVETIRDELFSLWTRELFETGDIELCV